MVLPALKSYRGYMLPLNWLLSYLWLTSLIFSSYDYSGRRCLFHAPPLVSRCGLKHTIMAFHIIGLYVSMSPLVRCLDINRAIASSSSSTPLSRP